MTQTAPEIWFPNLGIEIETLDNIAFSIGGLSVYWYGLLIGIGILLALLLIFGTAKRTGQSLDMYYDLAIWTIAAGIIGARLYYVAFNWESYRENLMSIINLRQGGLAIYGGVLLGILVGIIYCAIKKQNTLRIADTAMPGVIVGQIVGRWGNFINREVFGGYTNGPLAMRYLASQVKAADITPEIAANVVKAYGAEYIQVHPTFLYESLWNVGVLILMLLLWRSKKKADGQVMALYFIGYGIGRFWIEGIRTDQLMLWNTGLPVSQVVSAVLVLVGIILWVYSAKAAKKAEKQ